MKLVKIKDIRVGQIYKILENIGEPFVVFEKDKVIIIDYNFTYSYDVLKNKNKFKLIGFLGITHELKDNELIEIKREKFEVDDIIHYNGDIYNLIAVENGNNTFGFCSYELFGGDYIKTKDTCDCFNKIGILGVTHEFINNKMVK